MTPYNEQVTTAVLKIMRTCLELKTVGVDAFFSYSPHVNQIDVSVHPNGWKGNEDAEPIRFYIYIDDAYADYALCKLNSIQGYLLGLFPSDEKEATPCQ